MFTEAPTTDDRARLPVAGADGLGRALRDLRLSVTDRCNFRCGYCMPKEVFGRDHAFQPKSELLSFEEMERLARIFVGLGVEKIRVTGGEPLLKRDLPVLIGKLAALKGLKDLAMTTNGSALAVMAKPLFEAGLKRVTVSVDALDDSVFRRMNDVDFPVNRVLKGIDAALEAGFGPVKINMVVKRGVNEDQMVPMARHFAGPQYVLRFIEYMDVGATNGWRLDDVVTAKEIVRRLSGEMDLLPVAANYVGEVARRFRCAVSDTEIGVIASVTQPFCRGCTRARVAADGEFFTCLFGAKGHDLRALLRGGLSDERVADAIRAVWGARDDRYSEVRSEGAGMPRAEMSKLGG
ncbi:GTP 3',8-cyclase MoaA [Phragmitibacter flavus]|uniref:GTP 3',8-cyclase n=1 Tax=Phragmitibacter flavus TaxID=2576071 RepID=A0A5R8KIK5_9BACT|nr:GTP 3',8-cyclase MoaA [Phragmitibacter flavus]TLD72148.1 GTP 3',8-cyclase MoaA [Phragmitibacter flavus]